MERHVNEIHNQEKKHICQLCDKSFFKKDTLEKHAEILHHSIKNYSCELCETTFGRKHALEIHVKRTHEINSMDRNHICNHCMKSFITMGDLKIHIEVSHYGIKKYGSDKCSLAFGYSYLLKRHFVKCHLN